MILVDTNVVSEPLKPAPEPRVQEWLDRQPSDSLYLSTISVAEMMYGVEVLPEGRRRQALGLAVAAIVERLFADRLLAFDFAAARAYAVVRSRARASGFAIGFADAQIAATALAAGFRVATRDVAPFQATGVSTINPWTD